MKRVGLAVAPFVLFATTGAALNCGPGLRGHGSGLVVRGLQHSSRASRSERVEDPNLPRAPLQPSLCSRPGMHLAFGSSTLIPRPLLPRLNACPIVERRPNFRTPAVLGLSCAARYETVSTGLRRVEQWRKVGKEQWNVERQKKSTPPIVHLMLIFVQALLATTAIAWIFRAAQAAFPLLVAAAAGASTST